MVDIYITYNDVFVDMITCAPLDIFLMDVSKQCAINVLPPDVNITKTIYSKYGLVFFPTTFSALQYLSEIGSRLLISYYG